MSDIDTIDTVRLNFSEGGLLVLDAILGIVMFGIALDLKLSDFRRLAAAPKAAAIGLFAQYGLFPAATFGLTMWLKPPPSLALGMMLIAACPAGNLSNFLTHLARGNTALSIALSAVSTCAAVVLTPLVTTLWGSLNPATAPILRSMQLDPIRLLGTVGLVLGLPLVLGRLFAMQFPAAAERVKRPVKALSVVLFVAFVAVALQMNFAIFLRHVGAVALIVAVQDALALALGYAAARAARLPEADARAIAIECGIRNSGLGLVLIFSFFSGLGGMAVIAAWWGIWHVVSGLALATWWSRRPVVVEEMVAA